MHKILIILAVLLFTGCYSITHPLSQNVLRGIYSMSPPAGCTFEYIKVFVDKPTQCYCNIVSYTADGEQTLVIFAVDDEHCLKELEEEYKYKKLERGKKAEL